MNFWNPKHFKSKNGNFCIHCFLRWLYDSGVLRLPANSKVIIQCIYWKASWWRKLRKVSLVKFNVIPLAGVSSRAVQALFVGWARLWQQADLAALMSSKKPIGAHVQLNTRYALDLKPEHVWGSHCQFIQIQIKYDMKISNFKNTKHIQSKHSSNNFGFE